MPEIEEEVQFNTTTDQMDFNTKTNGDRLIISDLRLTKEKAATMAWLVNHTQDLTIEIRLK